jgi:hypothetical protein
VKGIGRCHTAPGLGSLMISQLRKASNSSDDAPLHPDRREEAALKVYPIAYQIIGTNWDSEEEVRTALATGGEPFANHVTLKSARTQECCKQGFHILSTTRLNAPSMATTTP